METTTETADSTTECYACEWGLRTHQHTCSPSRPTEATQEG